MKKYQFFGLLTVLLAINSNVEESAIARGGSSLAAIISMILAGHFLYKGEF